MAQWMSALEFNPGRKKKKKKVNLLELPLSDKNSPKTLFVILEALLSMLISTLFNDDLSH